ncbi:DinB family protein [Thalassobacillus devorans]|uniref:DinB family protein n=1 Tax=Thalassobacillus devorans TaxID=279813 RepID=UPI00048BB6EB|nr:DinB family protein [Thalassobacillus devorans]
MSKSNDFIQYFLSHRSVTNELAAKIGTEDVNYQPTPTSMPARKLVNHMLKSFYQFTAAAAQQEPKQLFEQEEDASLTELAETYTSETKKLIESMSDEDFSVIVDLTEMLGVKLPAEKVLNLAMDHEIHHKGNLFVYVREMGNTELPMFVKQG